MGLILEIYKADEQVPLNEEEPSNSARVVVLNGIEEPVHREVDSDCALLPKAELADVVSDVCALVTVTIVAIVVVELGAGKLDMRFDDGISAAVSRVAEGRTRCQIEVEVWTAEGSGELQTGLIELL